MMMNSPEVFRGAVSPYRLANQSVTTCQGHTTRMIKDTTIHNLGRTN
jgi:hypothetical protein